MFSESLSVFCDAGLVCEGGIGGGAGGGDGSINRFAGWLKERKVMISVKIFLWGCNRHCEFKSYMSGLSLMGTP